MSRHARLALLALTALLLIFPLTLGKPGLPPALKADEPAYYLMGLSLVRDGDLRLEVQDIDRLFDDFPHPPIRNLIVMTDDGWHTVTYSKPLVYSLFAAPFAHLFGANGYLFFNQLMVVSMIWMGALYLRRFNSDGLAVVFSAAFVLLSVGWVYAFWIHPEIFNMAAISLSCFATFRGRESSGRWSGFMWAATAGASLALAAYNKPIYAPIGAALVVLVWKSGRWRGVAGLGSGGVLASAAVIWLAVTLQGPASPYLGGHQRRALTVCEPGSVPVQPVAAAAPGPGGAAARAARPRRNWGFLLGKPVIGPTEFFENVRYFLWGRHTGFLLYLPFGALCILFFALEAPRDGPRWVLLGSLTAIAAYTLLYIPINWQGGGGFVGNRYFIGVYPAFIFLVRAIRPAGLMVPATAAASLFLMPILVTPFGRTVPSPTMQSHVRNSPFGLFPLEFSLKNVPGYRKKRITGGRYLARSDQILHREGTVWVRGGDRVEIWYELAEELQRPVFLVKSHAPDNDVTIRVGSTVEKLEGLRENETHRIELAGVRPTRRRKFQENHSLIYKIEVESTRGAVKVFMLENVAKHCGVKIGEEAFAANFYSGLEFSLMGEAEILDRDIYSMEWGEYAGPHSVMPGDEFAIQTEVRNASDGQWFHASGARLNLSYHWLDADGEPAVYDGARTSFPRLVEPGDWMSVKQNVIAPDVPGSYILELDAVFEHISWFSERNGGQTLRVAVEVEDRALRRDDPPGG
ncbi:MAG: hypothetical protein VYE73_00655 [Acidobacteriota bacterium]|nr:hypothetical protein [Acidobacteriota bacterium]